MQRQMQRHPCPDAALTNALRQDTRRPVGREGSFPSGLVVAEELYVAGELQKILKHAAEVEPLLRRVAHHEVVTTAPLAGIVVEVLRTAAKL
jgi:hypothetical protein